MERLLSRLLLGLLGKSGALGVGIVDANGLLVQSDGLHGGKLCQDIASHLSHVRPATFKVRITHLLEGELATPQDVYVRWLVGKRHFVYVMLGEQSDHKLARQALRAFAPDIEALVSRSGVTARQRLEQPREFTGRRLVR